MNGVTTSTFGTIDRTNLPRISSAAMIAVTAIFFARLTDFIIYAFTSTKA